MIFKSWPKDLTKLSPEELEQANELAWQRRKMRNRAAVALSVLVALAGGGLCVIAANVLIGTATVLSTIITTACGGLGVGASVCLGSSAGEAVRPDVDKVDTVYNEKRRRVRGQSQAENASLIKTIEFAKAQGLPSAQAVEDFAAAARNGVAEKVVVLRPLELKKNAAPSNLSSFVRIERAFP